MFIVLRNKGKMFPKFFALTSIKSIQTLYVYYKGVNVK